MTTDTLETPTQPAVETGRTTEYRDPSELRVHPLLRNQHELPEDSNEFYDLVDDIRDRGFDYPVLIDSSNQILDGRHRWRAAKRLKLESIPVVVRNEEESAEIIIGEILNRRHYTKGQLAYVIVPILGDEKGQKNLRWLKNLQKPQCFPKADSIGFCSQKGVASRLGLSPDTLQQAQKLHEIFDTDDEARRSMVNAENYGPSLREQFEPRIFDAEKPMGLGAALAGIAGQQSTKDRPKNADRDPGTLFVESFHAVTLRWSKLMTQDMDASRKAMRQLVQECDESELDSLEAFAAELKAACRLRQSH